MVYPGGPPAPMFPILLSMSATDSKVYLSDPADLSVIDSFTVSTPYNPRGLELIQTGTYGNCVYVNGNDDKVRIYDLQGNLQHSFGSTGAGNGQFTSIDGICVVGNELFVSDTSWGGNGRVQVFDFDGVYIRQFNFGAYTPSGLANIAGDLAVGNADISPTNPVLISDTDGNILNSGLPVEPYSYGITGLATTSTHVYVIAIADADGEPSIMVKYNSTMNYVDHVSTGPEKTNGLGTDGAGRFWRHDRVNDRIVEFTEGGLFVRAGPYNYATDPVVVEYYELYAGVAGVNDGIIGWKAGTNSGIN